MKYNWSVEIEGWSGSFSTKELSESIAKFLYKNVTAELNPNIAAVLLYRGGVLEDELRNEEAKPGA